MPLRQGSRGAAAGAGCRQRQAFEERLQESCPGRQRSHVAPLCQGPKCEGSCCAFVLHASKKVTGLLLIYRASCQASGHGLCWCLKEGCSRQLHSGPCQALKPCKLPCRPPRRPFSVPTTWPSVWRSTTRCSSVDAPVHVPTSSSWTSGRWSRRLVGAGSSDFAVCKVLFEGST